MKLFEDEHAWLCRDDGTLLLNPFIKMNSYSKDPDFHIQDLDDPNVWTQLLIADLRAFSFLRTRSLSYAKKGDFAGPVASKYHATIHFLNALLGPQQQWALELLDHLNRAQ